VNTHHLQLLLKDNQTVAEVSDGHLLWFYGIPKKNNLAQNSYYSVNLTPKIVGKYTVIYCSGCTI